MAKILVIDDEVTRVQMVTELLRADGHEVLPYNSGNAVVEALEEQHPELVITAESEVEVLSAGQLPLEAGGPWDLQREQLLTSKDPASLDARAFALSSPLIPVLPELAEFARPDALIVNGPKLLLLRNSRVAASGPPDGA